MIKQSDDSLVLKRSLRIGSGAGFSGDRIEPAIDLIEYGDLDYIGFECLAERTISIAARNRKHDPNLGYNDLLEERFEKILPAMMGKKIKVITNMGAANPIAATKKIYEIAKRNQLSGFKIAAVVGDDIVSKIESLSGETIIESGIQLEEIKDSVISANAYCGVKGILTALEQDANIIITGRVSDPALFLAPLIHEFQWRMDDWDLLGKGTLAGHLLECSAQVCGGYFADPGYKDVPDLWNIGFPIAEVSPEGEIIISKLETAGGVVSEQTVKEQTLYEIMNPESYHTPDVIADFSEVIVQEIGKNKVKVTGAKGKPKSSMLKVSIGYSDGFIGEGEISYGGSNADKRALLAGDIIKKRIEYTKLPINELRIDCIGLNSLYGDSLSRKICNDDICTPEVRLRVAGRVPDIDSAKKIGREVEALYLNGPAGGGGATRQITEIVSIVSVLISEELVQYETQILEV